MKSKVYQIPCDINHITESDIAALEIALTFRSFRLLDRFKSKKLIGLKLPESSETPDQSGTLTIASGFVNILKREEIQPFLCNTSNRYKERKANAVSELIRQFEIGFEYNKTSAPFIMLDGISGDYESVVVNDAEHKDKVHIAGEVQNLNGLILLSVPKENRLSGLTGALSNLGTGLASKKGKILQYSMSKPKVDSDRCYYCRKCFHVCPVHAIKLKDRHVEIDAVTIVQ